MCVCVCVMKVVSAGVLSMDGLACYHCCTVLAFFLSLRLYSAPSSGRTRGSRLVGISLLVLVLVLSTDHHVRGLSLDVI